MLFNSLDFAIFLPIVFGLYWSVTQRNLKQQNLLILVSSYVFYGWWDWRFLSLIAISTLADFGLGLALGKENNPVKRKWFVAASVAVNIGFLAFFKYFNFFVDSFTEAFSIMGITVDGYMLDIILPVGISFYTFQTLSYTIDVYRKKIDPTHNLVAFGAFVAFFPQLVAGPIDRATNLLPQFFKKRNFHYDVAVDGMRQILWGLFKKVIIADGCGVYVDLIFDHSPDHSASTLLLGSMLFSIQVYGDFSGYSDIAIGLSKLFGFRLIRNFSFPFFAQNIAEFWRRWHISLSKWFKDYLYIPMGGSKGGVWKTARNIFIIFAISGLWHGAKWKFVAWGLINAAFFVPLVITKKHRKSGAIPLEKRFPSMVQILRMGLVFLFFSLTEVFVRADDISHSVNYLVGIFDWSLASLPSIRPYRLLLFIAILMGLEWLGRSGEHALEISNKPKWLRWLVYFSLLMCIILFGTEGQQFIYFQF